MELLKYTNEWVKGEILQGKIMLAIGIIVLIGGIAIIKSDNEILRGTLIPLALILLIFLGYGGYQTFGRQAYMSRVTTLYMESPEKAVRQEYDKAVKDDRTYRMLKTAWPVLIVLSAVGYFIFSKDHFKGLAIGLIGLFLTTLVVDSILHHRLETYLKRLSGIITA